MRWPGLLSGAASTCSPAHPDKESQLITRGLATAFTLLLVNLRLSKGLLSPRQQTHTPPDEAEGSFQWFQEVVPEGLCVSARHRSRHRDRVVSSSIATFS